MELSNEQHFDYLPHEEDPSLPVEQVSAGAGRDFILGISFLSLLLFFFFAFTSGVEIFLKAKKEVKLQAETRKNAVLPQTVMPEDNLDDEFYLKINSQIEKWASTQRDLHLYLEEKVKALQQEDAEVQSLKIELQEMIKTNLVLKKKINELEQGAVSESERAPASSTEEATKE